MQVSQVVCGWMKDVVITDVARARGVVEAPGVTWANAPSKVRLTQDPTQVDCRRCLRRMERPSAHARETTVMPIMPALVNFETPDATIAPVIEELRVTHEVYPVQSWHDTMMYRWNDAFVNTSTSCTVTLRMDDATGGYETIIPPNTRYLIGGTMSVVSPWHMWVTNDWDTTGGRTTILANGTADAWVSWQTTAITQDEEDRDIVRNWAAQYGMYQAQPRAAIDAANREVLQRGYGEQYQLAEERRREAQLRQEENRKQLREAEAVAEKLLVEHVTSEQRKQWENEGRLICRGTDGRRYGIRKGRLHNIVELAPDGKAVANLCCLPSRKDHILPDADVVLGQLLHLQFNTEQFRKTANITKAYNEAEWPVDDLAGGVLVGAA